VQPPGAQAARRLDMKKNATDKAPQGGRKPFFAHLLEAQELEQAAGGVARDYLKITLKWPSDGDDFHTLKYPSDSDECDW
jgi:hypothetical protein